MKQVHRIGFYFCILSFFVCSISCDADSLQGCEKDYDFYYDNFLHFKVLDKKTGVNLLQIGINKYHRDTVRIYDEKLRPVEPGAHPDIDGSISFAFLDLTRNKNEPLDELIEHTYFLYLEKKDYDTIHVAYRIGLDKCKQKILSQLSVSYNDSIYYNSPYNPNRFAVSVNFLKEGF